MTTPKHLHESGTAATDERQQRVSKYPLARAFIDVVARSSNAAGTANNARTAFTLVELLVVIAIIGILAAVMMPALSTARQAGRRLECSNKLMRIGMAMNDYEQAFGSFPAGTVNPNGPVVSKPAGMHHSWLARILPYMDQPTVYRKLDYSQSVYAEANRLVRDARISDYICPSESRGAEFPMSSYAGCHNDIETPIDTNNNGVLFLNSAVARTDIVDGLSQTIMVGEKISKEGDMSWLSGTRATLRNAGTKLASNDASWVTSEEAGETIIEPLIDPRQTIPNYVGGFGSHHAVLVNFLFADGSIQSLPHDTSPQLLQQLANRKDAAPMSWP